MNAVVLAGGGADAVSALVPGVPNKAFVPVGGRPLVARVIAALRSVPLIERIVAVAPAEAHGDPALADADERRPSGARMIDSLRAGATGFAPDETLLIVAADLPVLGRAGIEEFVRLAAARDLDIAYAIVARATHERQFPGVPHTWAHMAEGRFCGGGIVALKPRVLPALGDLLDRLGAARKSPLRLAALFGWDIVPRFVFGRLRIADAEHRASAIVGAPAGAVICSHADVAVNVDRPSDVPLANGLLGIASKIV